MVWIDSQDHEQKPKMPLSLRSTRRPLQVDLSKLEVRTKTCWCVLSTFVVNLFVLVVNLFVLVVPTLTKYVINSVLFLLLIDIVFEAVQTCLQFEGSFRQLQGIKYVTWLISESSIRI